MTTMITRIPENQHVPSAVVLAGAPAAEFTNVLVIGQAADGRLYVACSGNSKLATNLAEQAVKQIDTGKLDWRHS